MADVQLENGYIRIATELLDEIIRRDFSKRQLAILHFIIRLSYGCHKKDCVIEKYNYFEIAGVNKVDVKKELKFLKNCWVINWDESTMIFSINKDYEKWQITPSKGFEREKFDTLIHQNILKKVSKTLTDSENVVSKILTESDEKVSKIRTSKLVKYELTEQPNSCESKDELVPKDSIKDSSLKIVTTTNKDSPDSVDLIAERFTDLKTMQLGHQSYPVVEDYQEIAQVVAQGVPLSQTIEFLEQCFKEYQERNPNGKISRFKYCAKYILDHYQAFLAKEKAKKAAKSGSQIQNFNSYKPRYGHNKPIRTEQLPDWFDNDDPYSNSTQKQTESGPESSESHKQEIDHILSDFRKPKAQ